ncbi:Y-family DNA polymerase [Aequoribacter sp.]|uniref:Y-family DNA polymerase n=1 Tax=Aequoribacter sp. TaxID=2847771 RepID=UPI003F6A12EE
MWLCVRFPQWELDSIGAPTTAAAIVDKQIIICVNQEARTLGIRTGQNLGHALQLANNNQVSWLDRDPAQEHKALNNLIAWGYRYTSTSYSDFGSNLLLRIGPSLKLFKGVNALLHTLQCDLKHYSYHYHLGIGHSPIGSWLASFLDSDNALLEASDKDKLGHLSLRALSNLYPKDVDALRKSGLVTLSDAWNQPRAELRKRCSKHFVEHLEHLCLEREAYVPDYQPPKYFLDRFRFGYDLNDTQELWPGIEYLLNGLSAFLRHTQHRTASLTWHLGGIHRYREQFTLRSSQAHSHITPWLGLMAIRLESLQLKEPIDSLMLECRELLPLEADAIDLFGSTKGAPKQALSDRLRTRLGHQAVQHIRRRDEHIPEYAHQFTCELPTATSPQTEVRAPRPLWLLNPPVNTQSKQAKQWVHGDITLMLGPERIEDYWWESSQCRDYYIAIDKEHYRFWVFRDRRSQQWYLHGIFE